MARFVLLTLALVASASATLIPVAMHQIVASDVIGAYRLAANLGNICPRFITHNATINTEDDPLSIPHSVMTQNRRFCRDNQTMTVYLDAQEAKNAVTSGELKSLIDDYAATEEAFIYGVELEGRKCGGSARTASFSQGTLIILFNPESPIRVGGIAYNTGRVYMIIDDPDLPGICIYKKFIPSPSPSPLPEVTPDTEPTDEGGPMEPSPGAGPGGPGGPGVVVPGGNGDGSGDSEGGDLDGTAEPSPEPGTDDDDDDPDSSPEDDGSVCFPADASVELEDGSVKKMSNVELGDRVKVADGSYSDVFMFTHKDATAVHSFVRISTVSGSSLTATQGHYIYINGGFAAAGSAKVGDVLELGNGARTVVNDVSVVKGTGLFNPQTVHGDIIVNSIRASTFTRTIEPSTAQAMLAPLRVLYETLGFSPAFLDNGADMIASVLPKGQVAL